MSVQGISQMACDARMMEHESRSVTVQIIAAHLEDALEMSRSQHSNKDEMSNMMCYRRGCASFVTSLYVVIKCLYFLNVLGNMVILDSFLGTHNLFFGFFILRDIVRGSEWFDTGYFPRVTLCDFEVRVLGNVHHHTIQCVLMINLFNEKIFLFLWFWFFFIAIMTALSLVHWAFISYLPSQREAFVKRYLRATDIVTDRASIKKFIGKFLGYDGVFAIRMVSAHAGDIMTTELIGALWNDFTNRSHRYGADQHEVTDMSSVQVPPQQKRQSTWSSGAAKKGYVGGGGGPSRAKGKRRKGSESFSFV